MEYHILLLQYTILLCQLRNGGLGGGAMNWSNAQVPEYD